MQHLCRALSRVVNPPTFANVRAMQRPAAFLEVNSGLISLLKQALCSQGGTFRAALSGNPLKISLTIHCVHAGLLVHVNNHLRHCTFTSCKSWYATFCKLQQYGKGITVVYFGHQLGWCAQVLCTTFMQPHRIQVGVAAGTIYKCWPRTYCYAIRCVLDNFTP